MLKPYYEDGSVTIYHGEALDILPNIKNSVDLILTDPPYGIEGGKGGGNSNRGKGSYKISKGWEDTPDYIQTVIVPSFKLALDISSRAILTPGSRCCFMYPEPASVGAFFSAGSTGWTSWGVNTTNLIFYYGKDPRGGEKGSSPNGRIMNSPSEKNGHPCPKPLKEWAWLLAKGSLEGETVLDPFMGSGTTLRAAKDLGRKAIGIEIEEKYCEIAARRMAQEVLL